MKRSTVKSISGNEYLVTNIEYRGVKDEGTGKD